MFQRIPSRKRTFTEREKILLNCKFENRLLPTVHKEFFQLSTKKTIHFFWRGQRIPIHISPTKTYVHVHGCPIRTLDSQHWSPAAKWKSNAQQNSTLHPLGWLGPRSYIIISVDKTVAKLEPSLLVGMYNGTATLEKQWQFLKVTQLPYDPAIALLDIHTSALKSCSREILYVSQQYCSQSQKVDKQNTV